ncbi:MAG: DUF3140 domain-containing protein [Geminicoccaceae bacterium]|nr:DUF3140 domain-containing protein [Geminicoccaceae bacterium]
MDEDEKKEIRAEFGKVVNMTPSALEDWLETEDSQRVGWTHEGEDESVGHHSGRRIVEIKRKKTADYDEGDYGHMKKVIGYVHRHLAQRPDGDVRDTKWRYSLMNWGHDPLED